MKNKYQIKQTKEPNQEYKNLSDLSVPQFCQLHVCCMQEIHIPLLLLANSKWGLIKTASYIYLIINMLVQESFSCDLVKITYRI